MVRQRMTALDIKASVDELRSTVLGMRLQNVYDLNPKLYLLKFVQSDRKVYVLIECGVRIHITTFTRDKPKVPAQFTLKLRKHVRSWRLDAVDQVGFDRSVDFRFGTGEGSHHFVVEFYAKGNFILTDDSFRILMLLRTHNEGGTSFRVGETYPIEKCQVFAPCTEKSLITAMEGANKDDQLRTALCNAGSYGATVVDHVLLSVGLVPTEKKSSWEKRIGDLAKLLIGAFTACNGWFQAPLKVGGFLVSQSTSAPAKEPKSPTEVPPIAFIDFSPVMLKQFDSGEYVLHYEQSFSAAVEKFFLPTEVDRIENHNTKKDTTVVSKREKCLRDHQRRIEKLRSEEEYNMRKGELLQANAAEVDEAIQLIRLALATGLSWSELKNVLRTRQREGHPVANIIHELALERNSISVLLVDPNYDDEFEVDDEDQGDEGAVPPVVVEVDISMTAQANARRYYETKKASSKKLEKTILATDKALAGSEKKGAKVAERAGPTKKEIIVTRQPLWFEKFYWFITSFGHLVVVARDPGQADILTKRYMKGGDFFIHCDAESSCPAVVKNIGGRPIPMGTLEEAGALTVCRGKAWETKNSISAWWVHASQVSKRAPNGTTLGVGLFHIKGKKNFLPAMPLQLGLALVMRTNKTHPSAAESCGSSMEAAAMEFVVPEDTVTPSPTPLGGTTAKFPASSSSSQNQQASESPELSPSEQVPTMQSPKMDSGKRKLTPKDRRLIASRPKEGDPSSSTGSPIGPSMDSTKDQETGDSSDSPSFPSVPVTSSQPKQRNVLTCEEGDDSNDADESSMAPSNQLADRDRIGRGRDDSGSASGGRPGLGLPKSKRQLNKMKKIIKKYGEQDEEDREAAMSLIGHKPSKLHERIAQAPPSALKGKGGSSGKDEKQRMDEEPEESGQDPEGPTAAGGSGSGGKEPKVKFATTTSPERAGGSPTVDLVVAEHELLRDRSRSFEDEEARIAERIQTELALVPYFTGVIAAAASGSEGREGEEEEGKSTGEVVEECFIVIAPYSSVIGYQFKVKVTPGNEKRGAAAKEALHLLRQQVAAQNQLADLNQAFQRLTAEEVAQQLLGGIKLHYVEAKPTPSTSKDRGTAPRHTDPMVAKDKRAD